MPVSFFKARVLSDRSLKHKGMAALFPMSEIKPERTNLESQPPRSGTGEEMGSATGSHPHQEQPRDVAVHREATLGELNLYEAGINIDCSGAELKKIFENNPLLPGVILTDREQMVGMISRRRFFEYMSRPYSLELFSRRSLSELYFFIKKEVLVLDRDTPIFTGVRRSLDRSPELLYEPIVVVLAPEVYQLLDVHQLLLAQMRIHEITTEALHSSEAKSREQTKELSQTLQELQRTQSQLVQTEKMSSLGQLVAGMAHEINNPISFISCNIYYVSEYSNQLMELLQLYEKHYPEAAEEIKDKIEEIDDIDFIKSDLARILESMGHGVDRIKKIIESLRNFSRLDESDRKEVDIREGIENTLLLLQNRLNGDENKPAIETIRHFEDLPLVECYPGELNQVFMNIFANAIDAVESLPPGQERKITISTSLARKYSPANSAIPGSGDRQNETEIMKQAVTGDRQNETSVGTKHSVEELSVPASGDREDASPLQELVIIRIADSGLGMSEEVISRLFDPFFTTKPVGKGTGLGLSVSYQIIVEKHKGNLSCRSLPGRGTEFAIEIPIRGAKSVV